ncbi:hypothetical protein Clacol_007375 [Clathrus columnatus]|uniref:MRH domain-containing protein n=1 Tax=Clathrus columnatus TaxID=1419009 RepID=A0AAV5AFP8_9AGAM|nr:hypothetical protein Clacol_007375 [Clathrus columnatus]
MTNGSPCPGDNNLRGSTAIRFICDNNVFGQGQPQLIAHFPLEEETACGFFFEWRTHVACPTAKPGSGVVAIIAIIVLVLFILYIVTGVLYRRLVLGMQGLDQFPRLSIIPMSKVKQFISNFPDWIGDIRDHLRGGSRDLWPRSRTTGNGGFWSRRNDGFSPLAREEEEAMFRDQDEAARRFSLEEDDITSPQQLHTPTLPNLHENKNTTNHEGPYILLLKNPGEMRHSTNGFMEDFVITLPDFKLINVF